MSLEAKREMSFVEAVKGRLGQGIWLGGQDPFPRQVEPDFKFHNFDAQNANNCHFGEAQNA